jgi:hypothetical protein
MPRFIEFLDSFPRTPNQKVSKVEIPLHGIARRTALPSRAAGAEGGANRGPVPISAARHLSRAISS